MGEEGLGANPQALGGDKLVSTIVPCQANMYGAIISR